MSKTALRFLSLTLLILAWPGLLLADVRLPAVLGSDMVLQREKPIPIWGWDEPGTQVTVKFGDESASATADADGNWRVTLAARPAGGPHTLTVAGSTETTLTGVLVGEVWLCSGQSNMEWTVARSKDPQAEIQAANYPQIRHIKFPHRPSDKPEVDIPSDGWRICHPENAGSFTAVGYYFARNLHQELSVPIGIIGSNWGGTRIEPWTPPAGFHSVPALSDIADNLENLPAKNDQGNVVHQSPLALYNGMIHPILPFPIRGAIWYQGESNNGEAMLYHEKMKALIGGWRQVFKNPELPFYFVQLAPFNYGGNRADQLPGIWEAQTATLSVPHTGMAVTVDIGNVGDIHPKNKQDVGYRLALCALAKTYGKSELVYSGPIYKSMRVVGSKIHLSFDHVGGGLASRDAQALTHFEIAGDDKQFVAATAEIVGEEVVVSATNVPKPVAVRFAWNQTAEPNLSNEEGLPASPFRTDKW